jgi:Mn2+/Fe2+ NRAMP family transporter
VVLALQLPLAMFPLLHFTSFAKRMGQVEKRLVPAHHRLGQRDR